MTKAGEEDLDFYLMANLRPATTGLPMVVWVSERASPATTCGSRSVQYTAHGSNMLIWRRLRSARHRVSWPASCRLPTCRRSAGGFG